VRRFKAGHVILRRMDRDDVLDLARRSFAARAWREGQTGYPIVDAGMRQLRTEAWMHNRVRMIVASFLIKHLLIPWQHGEAWFWDTLVDADLGNNAANWQWVAGCGADAAPYFRIFNPVTQSKRFDPDAEYIRAWVPELATVAARRVHAPWEMSEAEQQAAGCVIGSVTKRQGSVALVQRA